MHFTEIMITPYGYTIEVVSVVVVADVQPVAVGPDIQRSPGEVGHGDGDRLGLNRGPFFVKSLLLKNPNDQHRCDQGDQDGAA